MNDINGHKEQTITGILLASQFDSDGAVTGIAIYDDNEEVYEIVKSPLQMSLQNSIQLKIIAKGQVWHHPNGSSLIRIRKFALADIDLD